MTVNVLWTGGWDSTFRLLQCLILESREVQPYYLIDPKRRSTGAEIRAMYEIKRSVLADHPDAKARLLPTLYRDISQIREDAEITAAYERFRSVHHVGTQYDWLARFPVEEGIEELEMAVDKGSNAYDRLEAFMESCGTPEHPNFRIARSHEGEDVYTVFGRYLFPVFEMTKNDMQSVAEAHGLGRHLALTWFCHRPRKDGVPCGRCNPCKSTLEKGFEWRFPRSVRLRHKLRKSLGR